MDNNSIAMLKDYQSAIESSFKKMEKTSQNFELSDQSQQNIILNTLLTDLSTCKTNIGLMKMEISNLKEEGNVNKWQETIIKLQNQYEEYSKDINEKRKTKKIPADDPLSIDTRADLSKMSSQQVMDRGNKILESDRNAINNMKKIVNQDLDTMKDVNKELLNQSEKLENAEKDLKEIDYSLNRAGKQIKTMAKMYATDKLIMCMILCILLVIIAIVIVSFFSGGDDNANSKKDSFNNGD
jgi:hypothetical protein